MEKAATEAKSATVTLHSGASTLVLLAVKRGDGSATTTVTTRTGDKKSERGMTEQHTSMTEAKAHLATLAERAVKLGWQRRQGALQAKPDSFNQLPRPPKEGK